VNVTLGLKNILFIVVFLSANWLNRFGSVWFNRFQTLETEIEPNQKIFVLFNWLIRFFFCFLDLSVFLLTST